jgi:hypothetical protein
MTVHTGSAAGGPDRAVAGAIPVIAPVLRPAAGGPAELRDRGPVLAARHSLHPGLGR